MKSKAITDAFFDFFFYVQPEFVSLKTLLNSPIEISQADKGYETEAARCFDQHFIAFFYSEYKKSGDGKLNEIQDSPSLYDNYRFIKKHFGLQWVLYVFFFESRKAKKPGSHLLPLIRAMAAKRYVHRETEIKADKSFKNQVAPPVSVIIPTISRYVSLNKLLSQLSLQSVTPFEIIVVDQSQVPEKITWESPIPLIHLKSAERGFASSKNKGAELAGGEYLLFLDDDCEISPRHLEAHLHTFEQFPETAVSCGHITEGKLDVEKLPVAYGFRFARNLSTCNCMISLTVFRQMHGFNPEFNFIPLEDTDFFHRLVNQNKSVVKNLAALCLHKRDFKGGSRNHILNFNQYLSFYLNSAVLNFWLKSFSEERINQICLHTYMKAIRYYIAQSSRLHKIFIFIKLHLICKKHWLLLRAS